ncbi:MAG: hypothetical protein A3H42_03325 [Deltaproteobacteria bacterium RIFCSPLOWO2_02_FULL_46_8]|nr:MAG: hypothetical protein A3H42_03325 [Deltaproteobacteria bacterium RIFCSPLOWO2_02_FULL_46_8]
MGVWRVVLFLLLFGLLVNVSFGETDVDEPKFDVDTDISDSVGSEDGENSAAIGNDVEITGVAIINGSVWIDGVKIHKPQSVYTSRKNGKIYRIRWGSNDNVSVAEE